MDGNSYRLQKLKELLAPYGGDHREFCKDFPEASPDYLYQLLRGDRSFGERAAVNLAKKIGKPADFFERPKSSLSESQQLLIDAIADLDGKQVVKLIQAAGWLREGRDIKPGSPPQKLTVAAEKSAKRMSQ